MLKKTPVEQLKDSGNQEMPEAKFLGIGQNIEANDSLNSILVCFVQYYYLK